MSLIAAGSTPKSTLTGCAAGSTLESTLTCKTAGSTPRESEHPGQPQTHPAVLACVGQRQTLGSRQPGRQCPEERGRTDRCLKNQPRKSEPRAWTNRSRLSTNAAGSTPKSTLTDAGSGINSCEHPDLPRLRDQLRRAPWPAHQLSLQFFSPGTAQ